MMLDLIVPRVDALFAQGHGGRIGTLSRKTHSWFL